MPARTADHQPTTRGRGIPCDLVVGKVEAGWRGTAIDRGLQGPLAAFAFENPQVDLLSIRGRGSPAKPSAARRSRPRWSSMHSLQSYFCRCAHLDECLTFGLCGAVQTSTARPEVIGAAWFSAESLNQVQAIS